MANVTGELGGQPIILENAATEATLSALLQATLANSSSRSQAAKIQKAYEEALKKTTDQQTKTTRAQADAQRAYEDAVLMEKERKKREEAEAERRKKLMQGLQELGDLVGKTLNVAFSTCLLYTSDAADE